MTEIKERKNRRKIEGMKGGGKKERKREGRIEGIKKERWEEREKKERKTEIKEKERKKENVLKNPTEMCLSRKHEPDTQHNAQKIIFSSLETLIFPW